MKRFISFPDFRVVIVCLSFYQVLPQPQAISSENCATDDSCHKTGQNVRILFWNVENLFDYKDDTLTSDEEFTSSGSMHWSYSKLHVKLSHVAKTILAAGEWNPPAIIGMCEIENRYVLNKLVYNSPLKSFGYRIIHRNSPDNRGIDVAMLYREERFIPIYTEWINIRFPFDTAVKTRDILYVKGVLFNSDTVHLFANHWPSRRGGEAVSAPRRNYVASVLRTKIDSIFKSRGQEVRRSGSKEVRESGGKEVSSQQSAVSSGQSAAGSPEDSLSPYHHTTISPLHLGTTAPTHHTTMAPRHHPSIIIMGDFNDEPENESLVSILKARTDTQDLKPGDLVNMMYPLINKKGSHKFREHWGLLDQFIVSGSLLDKQHPMQVDPTSVKILSSPFLLEDDLKYLDKKPKRTYLGPRYKGGFSDHLPIVLDVLVVKESIED